MRSRHLGPLFATILAATAAVSSQYACGGSVDGDDQGTSNPSTPTTPTKSTPTTPSVPYETPFSCTTDESSLDALRAALGADYIERRSSSPGEGDAGGSYTTESSAGTACKTATDADACASALAVATSNEALFARGQDGRNRYLVVTTGDDVRLIDTPEAMLSWLGRIDHAAKAWLVALQKSYEPLCDGAWVTQVDGDWIVRTRLELKDCPIQYAEVTLRITADGTVSELERKELPPTNACAGRRPRGLVPAAHQANAIGAVGGYFAHVAHLEAASVHAFRILRDELAHHEAPAALLEGATRAMRDEIRHAAAMNRLARRYGAEMPPVIVDAHAPRSLEEMAIENAREGCVRELYGALEASWQAKAAADPEIINVMRGIARDETRHAELSLAVADWLDTKLDDAARERVRRVREHAFRELEAELLAPRDGELVAAAGMPTASEAGMLLRQLEEQLASAAA